MDEDFLDVTKTNSKTILIVLVIIVLSIICVGYYFTNGNRIVAKTVKHEAGEELSKDINHYLKNAVTNKNDFKLDLSKVDVDVIDTYTYSIEYKNKKYFGKIEIVDTKAPVFELKKDFKVEENDPEFFIGDLLSKCEDISKPCVVSFKKDEDENIIKKVGKYDIDIIVSDVYNNKKETKTTIEVVKKGSLVKEEQLDLTCVSESAELPNFNNEYFIKLSKAIKKDSEEADNTKGNIDPESIENYVKEKYKDNTIKQTEIVEMYNKYDYIVGFVVKIELNDGKIVYMTKETNEN